MDITDTHSLTITGAGPHLTTINGAGIDRVLDIRPNAGTVVISGVMIMGGNVTGFGGGIYNWDADLILINTVVSSSIADRGGGVYVGTGSATLSGGQIVSNTAHDYGGGVYVGTGSATLSGGQIVSNTANYGGGMAVWSGSATLSGGQIVSNTANFGGGVYVQGSATFTQTGASTITRNSAGNDGGGVYVSLGHATLSGGQIVSNTASARGGGVFVNQGSALLNGGQILSNTTQSGGGVYVFQSGSIFTQTGVSTITHNFASNSGGGVYVNQGSAMLSGGQILSNTANNGGGVFVYLGHATLGGGQIVDNHANIAGGGVYVHQGRATLSGGQILGNTADSNGGGVYVSQSTAAFTQTGDSAIALNRAGIGGGGVFVFNSGATFVSGGRIFSNTASYYGGGVYIQSGDATLNGAQVISNTASVDGGGGLYNNGGRLSLINTTVSGNRASAIGGGGLYINGGTTTLTYTTVASNTAAGGGGGIHNASGALTAQNTIVAHNGVTNCVGTLTSNGYNLEDGTDCGLTATGDISDTDPFLGPLAYDSGTWVHPLLSGSPAIDNGLCLPDLTTVDQRGVTRPQGPAGKCDIGAYEYVLWGTTTTLASSSNPSVFGQSVTFTAMVAAAGGAPTGVVAFKDGGSDVTGCTAQPLSGGEATCTTASLAAGAHIITAQYGGDAYFNSSTSSPLNQVVNKVDTTTGLTSSVNPSTIGQSVTFTAMVTSASGTPTGVVAFKDGGSDVTGCSAQPLSGGQATCTTALLAVGTHSITAQYGEDASFSSSTSSLLNQVVKAVIYLPLVIRNN